MSMVAGWDAIIIGSGAGGAAAAHRLVHRGLRVCVVEKGERLPEDGATLDVRRVIHQGEFLAHEWWRDGAGARLQPEERFNVGGKTRWYGAALLRFGSQEWGADEQLGTSGWPFALAELAPYYAEVERMLGVHQIDAEPGLAYIERRLRASGWNGAPLPMALSPRIAAQAHEARHFDGFANSAGLKGDAQSGFLDPLAASAGFTFITGCEVVALLSAEPPAARVRGVRLADGRELWAPHILLAAGALHSPRLLQRLVDAAGLADCVGSMIGRGLKLHHLTAVIAIAARRQTDVLRKTRIYTHPSYPHSSVQPLGFDAELIATLVPRLVPRAVARFVGQRAYGFFLQTEDASHVDNRVFERGAAAGTEAILDYGAMRVPVSAGEHRALTRAWQRALLRAGFISFAQPIGLAGTAHACGTLSIGKAAALLSAAGRGTDTQTDADTAAAKSARPDSVVDEQGRVRGIAGLYVVDGSILPRSGRVNPSLSIFAWGLRVADHLAAARLAHPPAAAP